ncbi:MAG: Holliday junction resolvase RuvX [Lachnospiraceae bacterium]|nr:Holliday junction resolvase RuvX [Lachnospiraceae bacterium]
MRYLGLDYGSRTVGVSITDELGITVQNLETITRREEKKLRSTVSRLREIIAEYQVSEIVLGLPLNMDGTEGERAERTRAFKELLEKKLSLPVHLISEQLTTVEADEVLEASGVPKKDRKKVIDQIAANFILQDYLRNVKHK